MTTPDTLLADQVFQLNTFLWALEDLPADGHICPVLREAGYYLNSIGRSVIMPTDTKTLEALKKLTSSADRSPCRPDLWLNHATDSVQPVIELKAQGFSTDSKNRNQALKLIAATFDLAPSLGGQDNRPGHVLYATRADNADSLANTLRTLARDLTAEEVVAAPTGTIGLSIEAEGVALSSPWLAELPGPLADAVASCPVVLRYDGANDLQPLYFVPWIPGIKDSQDADLQSEGLRQLTARVLIQMLAAIGQARPPTKLVLDGVKLLSDATFGVFDQWRDTDRHEFSGTVSKIAEQTLKPVVTVERIDRNRLEVDLSDADVQDTLVDRIKRADPANPSHNLETALEQPPTLFEEH